MSLVSTLVIFFFLPETHQWMRLKRLEEEDPQAAAAILEAPSIPKPVFRSPLGPLRTVLRRDVAPNVALSTCSFGFYFCAVTALPIALAKPPFSLPSGFIGLCYLPAGISCIVAAPLAGMVEML